MRKNVLWSVFFLFTLSACMEERNSFQESQRVPVQFSSSLEGIVLSRASGMSWTADDAIGVFSKKSGSELAEGTIVAAGDNVKYTTSKGDGNFLSGIGFQPIYYPDDNSEVDFIAYYPYREASTGFIYKVNVAHQTNPEAVDLLYSNNAVGFSKTNHLAGLSFSHQLSRLIFMISAGDEHTDLTGMTVTLSGMKTSADFNLSNGTLQVDDQSTGDITVPLVATAGGMKGEVIVLPVVNLAGAEIRFTLPGGLSQKKPLPTSTFVKGTNYSYTVNLKNGGSTIDPEWPGYKKWRETPVITKAMMTDAQYVVHYMPGSQIDRNYTMLYDTKYKLARWVAYPLYPECTGNSGRTDEWAYDPDIQKGWQPNLSSGVSGFDRGHQIPSGDRTYSRAMNETTFYYSNMTAQNGQMNQNIWAGLENKVRAWRSGTDTVFVVTGAMTTTASDKQVEYVKDNDGRNFAVPKYYFKALARKVAGEFYAIGFKMNNEPYPDRDYMKCKMSVSDLEKETGFTFFPTLPESVKSTLDASKWN